MHNQGNHSIPLKSTSLFCCRKYASNLFLVAICLFVVLGCSQETTQLKVKSNYILRWKSRIDKKWISNAKRIKTKTYLVYYDGTAYGKENADGSWKGVIEGECVIAFSENLPTLDIVFGSMDIKLGFGNKVVLGEERSLTLMDMVCVSELSLEDWLNNKKGSSISSQEMRFCYSNNKCEIKAIDLSVHLMKPQN